MPIPSRRIDVTLTMVGQSTAPLAREASTIGPRMRRRLTWFVVAPLVVLGSEMAHAADYWIEDPDPADRAKLLEETGHQYFEYAPLGAGLCIALLAFAFLGAVRRGVSGTRTARRLRLLPFAVLPPLVFVLQEHLERLFHDGQFPWAAALEPTFSMGLALQLPFALLAYIVARALLAAGARLGRTLRGQRPAAEVEESSHVVPEPRAAPRPRLSPLATSIASRAPPLAV